MNIRNQSTRNARATGRQRRLAAGGGWRALQRLALATMMVASGAAVAEEGFLEGLAKGLDSVSKALGAVSGQAPQESGANVASGETVPLKLRNVTPQAIIGFQVARPEDQYFSDNLVGDPLPANTSFTYARPKDACILNFRVRFANRTEKQMRGIKVCTVDVVEINGNDVIRSRNERLSGAASTLQSNLTGSNLTVAVRVANATAGCGVGMGSIRIPKSGWNLDFDNNYHVKLRAKYPDKYGYGDIYGVTTVNAWTSAKGSDPVALSFYCAE